MIDFVQGCTLNSVAKGSGAVAAHRRESRDEDTGFSFVNCNITGTGKILLGRAWGTSATITYSYCQFDKNVDPKGWTDWGISSRQKYVHIYLYICVVSNVNGDLMRVFFFFFDFCTFLLGLRNLVNASAEGKEQTENIECHGPDLIVFLKLS